MTPSSSSRRRWLQADDVLLVALVAAIVWIAGGVLLLVFAGILLAIALDGLADATASRTPLSRGWALLVVGLALLGLLALMGLTIVPQFLGQLDELWQRMVGLTGQLSDALSRHDWARRLIVDSQGQGQLAGAATAAVQQALSAGMALIGVAGGLIILVAIAIFAAADPALYRRGFLMLLPQSRRERVAATLAETAQALRWWFLGQLISMLVLGISVSVGLFLIGVDLWLSLGVITALLTFVPLLGPIIAGIPVVIIGFAEGVQTGLFVLVFYLVIQNLEGNFLEPMIQHRVVNLAPALLISVQVLMGALFGPLGLVLAAPLTVVGMVFVKNLYVEDVLAR